VLGLYVLDEDLNEVLTLRSDRVILCTGGCGKVYLHHQSRHSATGDGVAMAWRAGARSPTWSSSSSTPPAFTMGAQAPKTRSSSARRCAARAAS
jgi:L-aspartate oxidase